MRPLISYLLIAACSLAVYESYRSEVWAAKKPRKEPSNVSSRIPASPLLPAALHPTVKASAVSSQAQKQAKTVTAPSADPRPLHRKSQGKLKAHKKTALKAVVQPRRELLYHGVLEDPQRYDPRLNTKTIGVPNPQTPELIHDHFQELDRNQDGVIDPVERALGRLDIDRDLGSSQPQ